MQFHVLTLFPEMIVQGLHTSIIGRAVEQQILSVNAVNIRDYTLDKHGKVDDYTYGGGAGMLMQAQPVYDAYKAVCGERKVRTVYVTPQGTPFTQKLAGELSKEPELVFLCGHYEGIDERVLEEVVTDYISIGDYVLTGGELPAMVMIDAIARLVPGVLNNEVSAETESFHNDLLEYPQYSRPEVWMGKQVPEVLLSGNHTKIAAWRLEQSKERTRNVRPDLFAKYEAKEKLIKDLSKEKRNYIHMMESLSRGRAELIRRKGSQVLLYDAQIGMAYLKATDEVWALGALECLPKEAVGCYTNQHQMLPLLKRFWEQCEILEKRNACYTQKDNLYVRHKDIRSRNCGDIICYQAYEEETPVAYIEIKKDGIPDLPVLYHRPGAEPNALQQEQYLTSLIAYTVNKQKETGCIPYLQISAQDGCARALLEQMGLYVSGDVVYKVEKI